MLKYLNKLIGLQEIPDEISLLINITNCPFRCKWCHAEKLREDVGEPLTTNEIDFILSLYGMDITCVCFMGGDSDPGEISRLAKYIKDNYPFKVAWYSGSDEISRYTHLCNFDFIKLGPYNSKRGPLTSKMTNQRLYKIENQRLNDITYLFWE